MQVSLNAPYQVTAGIYVNTPSQESNQSTTPSSNTSDKDTKAQETPQKKQNPNELSEDQKRAISQLQARDSEVRAHEAAHQAAGGGMTGGASYTYQKGPDGRMYAIGGEVSISTKGGSTPQEEMANARQVQAAAMAPANPSGQDYAVATSAKVMEMKAQQELAKEEAAKMRGEKDYNDNKLSNDTNNIQDNSLYTPFDISA